MPMSQGWGLVLSCNDGSESWYVYGSYVDGRGVGDPNERLRVGPRTTLDVGRPKVGIAFCTLCSRMAFDAMHYAMHIIAAFCGILRRYLDVSRSIMDVGV